MTQSLEHTTAQQIAAGYASTDSAIELGAVVVNETVDRDAHVRIPLSMITRHGLIAGATGSGKTKTLQLIAEQLSAAGVPVMLADVKGDLSGLSMPGNPTAKVAQRAHDTNDDWSSTAYPVEFLSLGTTGVGVPLRATISSFGPILLAKVLGLSATQESALRMIFHYARQRQLQLIELSDLRAVINYLLSPAGKRELRQLGAMSPATAGVILRQLIILEDDGADTFFGYPEFNPYDLLRITTDGRGVVSLIELSEQATHPALFSTFLMWLLAKLYESLPEVGDLDKPKLVFFFDEAHLLFTDASKAFLEQVEQTIRLIRSKGVGVFFCTQLPTDIPNQVLSQLGARIQHALRAFTATDQQALAKTVRTYPKTTVYDLESALTSLGIGEAIVTVLSETGSPTPVAWTRMRSPRSLMGAINRDAIAQSASMSQLHAKYQSHNNRSNPRWSQPPAVAQPHKYNPAYQYAPIQSWGLARPRNQPYDWRGYYQQMQKRGA